MEGDRLYIETPLIESIPLSKVSGLTVYLKLENTQPSGSFKLRGLSNHCIKVSFMQQHIATQLHIATNKPRFI